MRGQTAPQGISEEAIGRCSRHRDQCRCDGRAVRAGGIDTEHLFGFTEGADIGKAGEREVEIETIARTGKSAGSYATVLQNYEAKVVPVQGLRIGAKAGLAYFDISGVGLEDRQQASLQGLSFEARYALVDRQSSPFGLTLIAELRWGRVDDISGEPARVYGGMLTVAMDKELIADRLFGAFNFLYDADATHLACRTSGSTSRRSDLRPRLRCAFSPRFFWAASFDI